MILFIITLIIRIYNILKEEEKVGKWVSFCCTVGYKQVTVIDGVKIELNDIIISLYMKNDFERRWSVSL